MDAAADIIAWAIICGAVVAFAVFTLVRHPHGLEPAQAPASVVTGAR